MSVPGILFNILTARHPLFTDRFSHWIKWRFTYKGGDFFIDKYLAKYSKRETEDDFKRRRAMTYLPAFAKEAVEEVKNSIFQRMADISRLGGSDTYQSAINGNGGGIDNSGTDMNTFIGQAVLPELLTMAKVGIFIDMPSKVGYTLADSTGHPYCYIYKTEDILNWTYTNINNCRQFQSIVLQDYIYATDPQTQLPTGDIVERTRHMWIDSDGYVKCQFDNTGDIISLGIKEIPFYTSEISGSLLEDVSNYQIALLNIASSDINYAVLSNFPFYTEQGAVGDINNHLKEGPSPESKEVTVGPVVGRYYTKERPGFIHPSSEPLTASMAKQEVMKKEIRQLVSLAVSNVQAKMASSESKDFDNRSLEAGLSAIGLELQRLERLIARAWSLYEKSTAAEVNYPKKYALKTDEDRWKEAEQLSERIDSTPSLTYKKELAKQIANIMLNGRASNETMKSIEKEIDDAPAIISPKLLQVNIEAGVVSLKTAAGSQGLKENEPDLAATDHADRLARIAEAQASGTPSNPDARGISDLSADPKGAVQEKNPDQTTNPQPKDLGRGKGKLK